MLGVVDLYSRRLKFLVSKTSKAEAVYNLYRRALLDWGVPEATRTDNGQDYTSLHFTRVLRELGVEHLLCDPFASEQKGTIERHLQTMSHGLLDLLPGFVGHNVAERKVIEARKSFAQRVMTPGETVEVSLTGVELQEKLDHWALHVYMHDAHEGTGMHGQTPFEKATAWAGPVRRISDEHALDVLLLEVAGTRTLTKKGLRLDNYRYIHAALCLHTGYQVFLRRDAGDMGRLYVWAAEDGDHYGAGEFICAARSPELTDISPQEVTLAAKRLLRDLHKSQAEEVRQHKRAVRRNIPQTIIEHRIAQSENVIALPHASTPYTTPALEQAARAARVDEAWRPEPMTPEQLAERERLLAEFYQAQRQLNEVEHDPDGTKAHLRWARIGRRIAAGEAVSEAERRGWACYQTSPNYRAIESVCASFDLTIDELVDGRKKAAG